MKKMNNSIKFLAMAFTMAVASLLISCSEDDNPIIIDEDPVVADGFYVLGTSTTDIPAAAMELGAGTVGNGELREGFYAAYIYLGSGSFNFVLYANNVATTYGGSVEALPMNNDEAATYFISKGTLTENGAAVDITSAGLYHVHVDLTSNLFFVSKVEFFEIIGSATSNGWDSGQKLSVKSASADAVVFEGTNLTLRTGNKEFKFRYNSNWDTNILDIDGLNVHSNFGADGIAGGPNFTFDQPDANYTVTITYTPGSGESLSWDFVKTGDAEEITYDPAFFAWGIIGAATSTGWDSDTDVTYTDWASTWNGVYYLGADVFKFRANDAWTSELNPSNSVVDLSTSITDNGDGNFVNATAGLFYVRISTPDEGVTWNLYVHEVSPGIIGAAVTNGWDGPDNNVPFLSELDGTITWKLDAFAFGADEWKIRLNDGWEYGYGFGQVTLSGANSGLLSDSGGNFKLSAAGNYTVTITTADNGATYSVAFD
jgi:hypothetical protein